MKGKSICTVGTTSLRRKMYESYDVDHKENNKKFNAANVSARKRIIDLTDDEIKRLANEYSNGNWEGMKWNLSFRAIAYKEV